MNDETIEDDLRRRHELEMLRARSPKIARIEARRDVKIARARSDNTMYVRNTLIGVLGATIILLGISGCSIMVWGGDDPVMSPAQVEQERKDDLQRYETCVSEDGNYDEDDNRCLGS